MPESEDLVSKDWVFFLLVCLVSCIKESRIDPKCNVDFILIYIHFNHCIDLFIYMHIFLLFAIEVYIVFYVDILL